jgi:hypothetical protein
MAYSTYFFFTWTYSLCFCIMSTKITLCDEETASCSFSNIVILICILINIYPFSFVLISMLILIRSCCSMCMIWPFFVFVGCIFVRLSCAVDLLSHEWKSTFLQHVDGNCATYWQIQFLKMYISAHMIVQWSWTKFPLVVDKHLSSLDTIVISSCH